MKEIGELFLEKRKEIGISIAEISKDLNIDEVLIENLESGNVKAFKDVIELKSVVSSLAKYLGFDVDSIMDDVNDYLFEKTSKISLDDIKNAYKQEEKDEKKVKSPYTVEIKKKYNKSLLIVIILILLILVILYFLLRFILMR